LEFVRTKLNELKSIYDIKSISFDRWGAQSVSQSLTTDGFTLIPTGQGSKTMNEPVRELKRLVMKGGLHHGGNPILRWMADCVEVHEENDLLKFVKPRRRQTSNRIDGMVALCMSLSRAILLHGPTQEMSTDQLINAYR
jgi:phage terminase large subunit-like protein